MAVSSNDARAELEPLFLAHVPSKVIALEFHPYHPWLLVAHTNSTILVWNYELKKPVYDINLLSLQEDDIVTLHQAAESSAKQQGDKKFGQIKAIKFFDSYTKKLKSMTESGYKSTPSAAESRRRLTFSEKFEVLETLFESQKSLIVIVTENRVLFFDYITITFSELRISSFEHKPQLSVDFFPDAPLICFGGSDGQIRIWDVEKQEFKKKLTGGHKAGVNKLFALQSKSKSSRLLLSGATDGAICLWDLASDTVSPKKMVSSELVGFTYNYLDGSLVMAEMKLQSERYLFSWDPAANHEVRRLKLKMKAIITSLEPFPHPSYSPSSILYTAKGDTKLYTISPDGGIKELCDIATRCPQQLTSGLKKLKIYGAYVHPLQPHVLACSTNLGIIMFYVDRYTLPIAAYSSSKNAVFTTLGDKIVSQELDEKATITKRTPIRTVEHLSGVSLLMSSSGKYLCVFYPEAHLYQIYDIQMSSGWRAVEEGAAYSFAWAGGQDRFAYLESSKGNSESSAAKATTKEDKRKSKRGAAPMFVKKTSQSASHGRLRIKDLENGEVKDVVEDLSWFLSALHAKVARLFGGSLLGLLSDPASSVPSGEVPPSPIVSQPRKTKAPPPASLGQLRDDTLKETLAELPFLQFYSWNTQDAVGSQLPPPLMVISSDSTVNCVALVYSRYVCIFACSPNLQLIYKINKTVTSGYWVHGAFFYATDYTIECVVPQAQDQGAMTVAFTSVVQVPPHLSPRPFGNLSFLSAFPEKILVLDALNQMHAIAFTDPQLQFCLLAAAKCIKDAMLRVPFIALKHHNELATCLVQLGYPKEATTLQGVPIIRRLHIGIKYNLFDVATEALCILLDEIPLPPRNNVLPLKGLALNFPSVPHSPASPLTPHTPHSPHSSHQQTALTSLGGSAGTLPSLADASSLGQSSEQLKKATEQQANSQNNVSFGQPELDLNELLTCGKKVATGAIAAGQLDQAEKLYSKMSNYDSNFSLQLALLHLSLGQQDKIKAIYNQLCFSKQYNLAKQIAVLLEDSGLLSFAAQRSSNFSEFIAVSWAAGTKEDELVLKWNQEFQRNGGKEHHDLRMIGSAKQNRSSTSSSSSNLAK